MRIILLLFITLGLYAETKTDMLHLFQNKKYEEVCNLGFENFSAYQKDEEFISLYAFGCLYSDYIDRLAIPVAMLKFTKEARGNSAYFSIILMQKKLLLHAMSDDYDLSSLDLPTTDYVLSKVFDLYAKLGKHPSRALYLFEDLDNPKISYKLYLEKDEKLNKIIIEEFYDTISVKRHIYW
ncbi:MAG: hypothetical protein RBR59_07590 [Sulfurimonadaceae bacterium]|jgi:hypothetical protein|nr:hypothetical protein [Sulfurimonadaceae bacterium]